MLNARIELRGEELFCADTGEGGLSTVRRLTPEALARLRGWAEKYDAAMRTRALPPLVEIGRDIAAFLDEGDRWLGQTLGGTIGEIALDIVVPGQPEERERILLDIPWELLAPNGRFLAEDDERLFRVTRRLGGSGTPAAPGTLDYEDEGSVEPEASAAVAQRVLTRSLNAKRCHRSRTEIHVELWSLSTTTIPGPELVLWLATQS